MGLSVIHLVKMSLDIIMQGQWLPGLCMKRYLDMSMIRVYDSRTNKQKFSPKINKNNFRGFWCNGKSWGIFKQEKAANGEMLQSVEVLYNWSDKQVKL